MILADTIALHAWITDYPTIEVDATVIFPDVLTNTGDG